MSPRGFLRDLVIVLACVGGAVSGVTRWLLIPFVVSGPSMIPTLRDGDRVLVDLWTLRKRLPHPGEIVVVSGPAGESLVKRVAREPLRPAGRYPEDRIPVDSPLEPSFIVLGDNPADSWDSREFGRVPKHRVLGRVSFRYWPVGRMGPIE